MQSYTSPLHSERLSKDDKQNTSTPFGFLKAPVNKEKPAKRQLLSNVQIGKQHSKYMV